jgi:hypothetical protein
MRARIASLLIGLLFTAQGCGGGSGGRYGDRDDYADNAYEEDETAEDAA